MRARESEGQNFQHCLVPVGNLRVCGGQRTHNQVTVAAHVRCSGLGALKGGAAGSSIRCCDDGVEVWNRLLFRSVHIGRFAGAPTLCSAARNIQAASAMLGWAPASSPLRGRKPEQGSCFYVLYGALLQNWLKPVVSFIRKPETLLHCCGLAVVLI